MSRSGPLIDSPRWQTHLDDPRGRRARHRGGWLPFLTAVTTAIALFALAGYQVTGEPASLRLLGRFSAALVEIDRWLPEHVEDLKLNARDRAEGVVEIRDLPVRVTLPAQDVVVADPAELRRLIVSSMAASLREHGNAAFTDADGVQRSPGINQPSYWTATLLNERAHSFWLAALPFALLVLLAFSAGILHSGLSLPTVIASGAAFSAIASIAVWLLASAAAGSFGAPVDKEVLLIVRDGAWLGFRNAFAVFAAALGLVIIFRLLEGERPRSSLTPSTSYPRDFPRA